MTTDQLIQKISYNVVNPLIALMFVGAVLVFLWGVMRYIRGADDETERQTGQRHMIYGVVGLVIMLSAVAIVNLIKNFLGVH